MSVVRHTFHDAQVFPRSADEVEIHGQTLSESQLREFRRDVYRFASGLAAVESCDCFLDAAETSFAVVIPPHRAADTLLVIPQHDVVPNQPDGANRRSRFSLSIFLHIYDLGCRADSLIGDVMAKYPHGPVRF